MYRPHSIANKQFALQNKTLASVYNIERDIVRLDERIKHSPCAAAVRKTLNRADALGVWASEGIFIDIHSLMRIEAAASLIDERTTSNEAFYNLLAEEGIPDFDRVIQTFRFLETVEWITDGKNKHLLETPQAILDLYARRKFGPVENPETAHFRNSTIAQSAEEPVIRVCEPPNSTELEFLLQDFCDFISKDTLSVLTQATIAQFQFEALKPFDSDNDPMERLIMHHILTRRELTQNITVPLNLFAAHFKDRFYTVLQPHVDTNSMESPDTLLFVEDLTLNMVTVAYEMLRFTISLNKMISSFIAKWKIKLGKIGKGSATELLIYHFAGTPIMTISQASKLIGKSFSTTSEAFARLESANIIRVGKPINRNKTFEALDAIALHKGMYEKRAITYEEWTA